jgi:hypothetical protein
MVQHGLTVRAPDRRKSAAAEEGSLYGLCKKICQQLGIRFGGVFKRIVASQ